MADSKADSIHVAIVGSGPSGIAAASVLLEKGFHVDIYDGGETRDASAEQLKKELQVQIARQLEPDTKQWHQLLNGVEGNSFWGLLKDVLNATFLNRIRPEAIEKRNLGSRFAFRNTHSGIPLKGLHLPRSMAVAGLSNVWGAASYPLRPDEYHLWPLDQQHLSPWYTKAEQLLNLEYSIDGLADCYPASDRARKEYEKFTSGYLEPMLDHWGRYQQQLSEHGVAYGRARIAVNRKTQQEDGCRYCGLCLTGCPVDAIWHAGKGLEKIQTSLLRHLPGNLIHSFTESDNGISLKRLVDGQVEMVDTRYDAVVLAAGALSSVRIAAQSRQWQGKVPILSNELMVVPFKNRVNPIGSNHKNFGLSEAVIAMNGEFTGASPAHMQLYRFTLPLLGPVANLLVSLPGILRRLFTAPFSRLVFGFIYLHSEDSARYSATVDASSEGLSQLNIEMDKPGRGKKLFSSIMDKLKSMHLVTGIKPVLSLAKSTPAGFSCHIGGTMPMRRKPGEMETDLSGRLSGTHRCYVVDAAVFPSLPAQNLTLTVMANAMRIANDISKEAIQ